ncbi:MAG: MotA/TolQ/ExbB proton channel family protein [Deltaproteobacteria bacterium]|nr:MotA/TolQ/ExbB proton channel family protein [Deltaproteobacteria bacterium]PIV67455.1 MAG: MotA/TolQ/ExbB proton channel family protein [Nitrospirae bacterium CG01_land_8_20_14_3_00_44_22]
MFEFFVKGGFLMYPIALCSVIGLTVLINKFIQYRNILKSIEMPMEQALKARPAIIIPILEGIKNGCDEKELSVIGTRQVREIEKGLSWLGLIATIAPLMGLTGTVTGMMKAFMVIAVSTSVNPSMLAGGIWEALITTAAGLLIAIPVHIGHHYLEKQADEIAFVMKEITMSLYMRCKDGV